MESILEQFFVCVPMINFSWKDVVLTEEVQKELIKEIFLSKRFLQYPPSRDYQISFLKQVMKKVEESNNTLYGEVYELLAQLMMKSTKDRYCYKSYCLEDRGYVTIKESLHLVTHGTTGLRCWEAALYFCEWIMENPAIFNKKNLLELGSGVGLLGLVTCIVSEPTSYTFTDCDANVLKQLQENVAINKSTLVSRAIGHQSCVSILSLDWAQDECLTAEELHYVIASDVVYDKETIDDLIKMLLRLWRRNSKITVMISSVIRSHETYEYFLTELDECDIRRVSLHYKPKRPIFYYDHSMPIELLKLEIEI